MTIGWLALGLLCAGVVHGGNRPDAPFHNPFARPAMLAEPPARIAKESVPARQAVQLELTATLVSDALPMVILGGELLGIGEEFDGYRLLSVGEGRAVFDRQGERHTLSLVGSGVDLE